MLLRIHFFSRAEFSCRPVAGLLAGWRSQVARKLNLVRQCQEVISGANLACLKLARKPGWKPGNRLTSQAARKYSQLCAAVIAGFGACEKDGEPDNDDSREDTTRINENTK